MADAGTGQGDDGDSDDDADDKERESDEGGDNDERDSDEGDDDAKNAAAAIADAGTGGGGDEDGQDDDDDGSGDRDPTDIEDDDTDIKDDDTDSKSSDRRSDDDESGDDQDDDSRSDDEDGSESAERADSDDDDQTADSDDDKADSDDDEKDDRRGSRGAGQDDDVEREGKAEKPPEEDDRDADDADEGGKDEDDDEEPKRATPLKAIPLILGVFLLTALGLYILVAAIAPTWFAAIVLAVIWLVAMWFAWGRLVRRKPHYRGAIRGAVLGVAALALLLFLVTMFGGKTVDEEIAVPQVKRSEANTPPEPPESAEGGTPQQIIEERRGEFESAGAGSAKGTARIVTLPDGALYLTFEKLDVPKGPGLKVYLAPGDGKKTTDKIDLGKLRGIKGTHQYPLPPGAVPAEYPTVVIYSSPLSMAFARATTAEQ